VSIFTSNCSNRVCRRNCWLRMAAIPGQCGQSNSTRRCKYSNRLRLPRC